jgi:nucleotide-binding universal stress UspA family protein
MARIERILCPVDFSDTSRHAVENALAVARWFHAPITALHVYTPPFAPIPGLPAPEERLSAAARQRVEKEMADCFAAAGDVRVDVQVDVGQPVPCILARAAALDASLIVIGTHGVTGFEHLVLGSVAEKVLRKARCPVLTVPPRARATSSLPFRRVLCAIDFSDPSLAALDLASSLVGGSGAALTLVHVVEWPWEEPPAPRLQDLPPEQAAALAEYRRYVEKAAGDRLRTLVPASLAGDVDVATEVVHGKAYVQILQVGARHRADLIVMGVHGRNVADVALFGSTTNQVVRRATCPVLTLRQ